MQVTEKKKTCLFELLFYNRHVGPILMPSFIFIWMFLKFGLSHDIVNVPIEHVSSVIAWLDIEPNPAGLFFFVWVWVFFFNFFVCVYVKSNILEQKIKGIEKQNTRTTDINTDQENTYKKNSLKTKFLN